MKKVGIVGYGHLGKYLTYKILDSNKFNLVFVWNRSEIKDYKLEKKYILKNLDDFSKLEVDLIIEVAHPQITEVYGAKFLQKADYMIGSPTVLANQGILDSLIDTSQKNNRKIFVPCGAFWGTDDIRKMDERMTLKGLKVTMKKHHESLKLEGKLDEKLKQSTDFSILYEGPVRELCKLAPNNVNTMAVACLVAKNLGFDNVIGCLIADKSLTDKHIIEIEVIGPYNPELKESFKCLTRRLNPAKQGNVTGNQTYESFYYSLLDTLGHDIQYGLQIC